MNYEKAPQLEEKESREDIGEVQERAGELAFKESALVERLPEGKLQELRKSGKLKKFISVMVLTSALSAGMVENAEAGKEVNWRRVGSGVERVYNRHSNENRREIMRELRRLERMFDSVDRDASRLARDYNKKIEKATDAKDYDKADKLADQMIEALRPYQEKADEIEEVMKEVQERLDKQKKMDIGAGIATEAFRIFGRR